MYTYVITSKNIVKKEFVEVLVYSMKKLPIFNMRMYIP